MTEIAIEALNELLGPAAVVVFLILAVQSPVLPFAVPPVVGVALAAVYALVGVDLFFRFEHPAFIGYAIAMAAIAVVRWRQRRSGGKQLQEKTGSQAASRRDDGERGPTPEQGESLGDVPASPDQEPVTFRHRLRQLQQAQDKLEPRSEYRHLSAAELRLPEDLKDRVRVYVACKRPGRYLAIPLTYVVARTDDEVAPALSMIAVLDPERPDASVVTFEAGAAPDLLPFHLELLRDELRRHAAEQTEAPETVDLHLPADLEESPTVSWEGPMTRLEGVVPDGEAIILRITARSLGEAAAVMERLRPGPSHHGLAATVRFKLGPGQTATASLFLNLGRTIGDALSAELLDHGKVELRNRTESEIIARNLLFVWPGDRRPALQRIEPEQQLQPGDGTVLVRPEGIERVLVDYRVEPSDTKSLPELRIDVGELDIRLAVDTDIQPSETFRFSPESKPVPLREIVVEVARDGLSPHKVSLRRNGEVFASDVVAIRVALDRYLAPEHRMVRYRTRFVAERGTSLVTDWEEMNYTEPLLTVTRQKLLALLRDQTGP